MSISWRTRSISVVEGAGVVDDSEVVKEDPTGEEEIVSVVVGLAGCFRSLGMRIAASVELTACKTVDGWVVIAFKTDQSKATRGFIDSIGDRTVEVSCLRVATGETVDSLAVGPA